jgi:putative DNA primase/helicase
MIDADDIARARARRIEDEISRRGITLSGRVERVGPCPMCGGVDRFGINTKKQIFNCRGCNVGGDVIALVQHLDRVSFRDAVEILAGHLAPGRGHKASDNVTGFERVDDIAASRRKARFLWSTRQPISGTLAEKYLRDVRGYRGALPATIGYLPPRNDYAPAVIAAFGFAIEPEPGVLAIGDIEGAHLIKLKPDGNKIDGKAKITIGIGVTAPVVLAPPNDLLGLAITEGIEDGLTAHAATGLGVWAACNAGRMPALAGIVPGYIECVTIFAHDDNAGQAGATALAERLHARGIEVLIEGLVA